MATFEGGVRACDQLVPVWLPWIVALLACASGLGWKFFEGKNWGREKLGEKMENLRNIGKNGNI